MLYIKIKNIKRDTTVNLGGKIWVSFIVQENGKITGKRIVRHTSDGKYGKQILDLIDKVKWSPGTFEGKAIPVMPVSIHVKQEGLEESSFKLN